MSCPFLDLPPDHLDVNVHPTKAEVRFRDPERLQAFLTEAVRARLHAEDLTGRLRGPSTERPKPPAPALEPTFDFTPPPEAPVPSALTARPDPPPPSTASSPPARPSPPIRGTERQTALPCGPLPPAKVVPPPPAVVAREGESTPRPRRESNVLPVIRAVQLHDMYLVVEVPEGVLVLDQHALHERILYEQLRDRLAAGDPEQQRLLVPEPIDLLAHQAALVLERRADLAGLGLEVEGFRGSTVLLPGYPAVLGKRTPQAIFRAVVDYLIAKEKLPAREEMLNDLLSLMACHAAVRAGDRLAPGGDRRPGPPARLCGQLALLPARPPDVAAVHPARPRTPVPPRLRPAFCPRLGSWLV